MNGRAVETVVLTAMKASALRPLSLRDVMAFDRNGSKQVSSAALFSSSPVANGMLDLDEPLDPRRVHSSIVTAAKAPPRRPHGRDPFHLENDPASPADNQADTGSTQAASRRDRAKPVGASAKNLLLCWISTNVVEDFRWGDAVASAADRSDRTTVGRAGGGSPTTSTSGTG